MRKLYLCSICLSFFLRISVDGQTNAPASRIVVPDLHLMATSLVKPVFSETAVAAGADGSGLVLRVIVDESGNVESAKCSMSCHPMLRDAAEFAAATSKFRPLIKDGQPVKYEGSLNYSFVVERVDWYRFGTFLESARQFDNISVGPAAEILSSRFPSEKAQLVALDAKGVDLETRWRVMREVETSLRDKIKGGDLWRFNLAMALRRITFWTIAGERIVRADLQKAIDQLPQYVAGAPEEIPNEMIDALLAVSKYRVPAELPERELRQAISNMTRNIRIEK